MKLKNKIAIITGGASGIGLATAKKFISEGATVVLTDVNQEEGERAGRELNSLFIKTDVSKTEEIQNLIDKTIEKYGQLDIMVNNAGVGSTGSVLDCTEEVFDKTIAVNLRSVFLGTKYAALKMKERGGVILNTTSILGQVGFNGAAAYCASKGGIDQLTRAAALDLAPYKIRVNAVAPGFIRTPMTKMVTENEQFYQMVISKIPLGRFGEPEEMANLFCFLASDEASYITGAVYLADAGWTAI